MKNANKIRLIFLITVLWAFLASFMIYGATIGTAVLLKGQMKVESQDTYQLYDQPNTTLEVNETDKIHTGAGTRVKIFLREKKEVIHLYAKSFLTMDKINEDQSDLSLLIGKARFVVQPTVSKLTSIRRKFQVRTSNAFIGVRGTDFIAQTDGSTTSVLTLDGLVAMANQATPDVEVEVGKNQASKTTGDAPPAPAADVPEDAIEKITTEDTSEDWEEVEFEEPAETSKPETGVEEPVDAAESLEAMEEVQEQVEQVQEQVDEAKDTAAGAAEATEKSIELTVTEQPD